MKAEDVHVNDIVRVERSTIPGDRWLIGIVAVVEDVRDGWALLKQLRGDGIVGGGGWIHHESLEPETGDGWKAVAEARRRDNERALEAAIERGRQWKALVDSLAQKHGVTNEAVDEIWSTLTDKQREFEGP